MSEAYHRRGMSDFLGDTRDLLRRTPDVLRALLDRAARNLDGHA